MTFSQKSVGCNTPLISRNPLLNAFIGCFCVISFIGFFTWNVTILKESEIAMIMGSLGSTSIILFTNNRTLDAHLRNILGGHFIATIVGLICRCLVVDSIEPLLDTEGGLKFLACALAVAGTAVLQQYFKAIHPPAAGCALIAVTVPNLFGFLGLFFIVCPALLGSMIICANAISNSNINLQYPRYWSKRCSYPCKDLEIAFSTVPEKNLTSGVNLRETLLDLPMCTQGDLDNTTSTADNTSMTSPHFNVSIDVC